MAAHPGWPRRSKESSDGIASSDESHAGAIAMFAYEEGDTRRIGEDEALWPNGSKHRSASTAASNATTLPTIRRSSKTCLTAFPSPRAGRREKQVEPIQARVVSQSLHAAILAFQEHNHCIVDGHVDPGERTIHLLNQLARPSPFPPPAPPPPPPPPQPPLPLSTRFF